MCVLTWFLCVSALLRCLLLIPHGHVSNLRGGSTICGGGRAGGVPDQASGSGESSTTGHRFIWCVFSVCIRVFIPDPDETNDFRLSPQPPARHTPRSFLKRQWARLSAKPTNWVFGLIPTFATMDVHQEIWTHLWRIKRLNRDWMVVRNWAERFQYQFTCYYLCDDMGLYVTRALSGKTNQISILCHDFFEVLPCFDSKSLFPLSDGLESFTEAGQFRILCVTRRVWRDLTFSKA